jgi:hypothetical protein
MRPEIPGVLGNSIVAAGARTVSAVAVWTDSTKADGENVLRSKMVGEADTHTSGEALLVFRSKDDTHVFFCHAMF